MKSYQEILAWMFSRLPMYQRAGASAYRAGLERIENFSAFLNHPERVFKSIHVAGTNGKGSTVHIIASILQEAGYTVGIYSSPHLVDFRERIKVNGKYISEEQVIQFISKHQEYLSSNGLSFFEMTVEMAFDYFAKKQVDFAIIEVGLGGRLDATNIITPVLSVITNIGLDHTQFLGDTLEAIALEKAGIIKEGVPVVIGEKQVETTKVFKKRAKSINAPIVFASELPELNYDSDLKGNYQRKNIQTATIAVRQIRLNRLSETHIARGVNSVVENTKFLGRWQELSDNPKVIVDITHNFEGFQYLVNQIKRESFNELHLVMGFVKGRNIAEIFEILPQNSSYYLSSPKLERSMKVSELQWALSNFNRDFQFFQSVYNAFQAAQKRANENDLILVCGSTFVVAEILPYAMVNA